MDEQVVERVRREFLEMPGLRLTPAQAARLLDIDKTACQAILDGLVRSAFLQRTEGGMVARATSHRTSAGREG